MQYYSKKNFNKLFDQIYQINLNYLNKYYN